MESERPNFMEIYPGSNTIEQMRKIASYYGGYCLSTEMTKNLDRLEWKCKLNHTWVTSAQKIKQGSWCKKCSAKKANESRTMTIQEMDRLAEKNGGKCLSIYYVNNNTSLWFVCKENHKFKSYSKSIKRGHWCKRCSNKKVMEPKQLTIKQMKELAKQRGGDCLSDSINNSYSKLLWKCSEGHKWKSTAQSVKNRKSWCPECTKLGGIKEEKVRSIFEQLFEKKFIKTRKVLDKRYELDGYNEELNIAFEYHGEQHYYFIKGIHFEITRFEERKRKDDEKLELCKEKDINLITIPYWASNTDQSLISFIKTKLNEMNIPFINKEVKVEQNVYKKKLKALKDLAASKGGECLSDVYHGVKVKLKFKCKNDHVFDKTPDEILNANQWCGECYGNTPYTLEGMQTVAELLRGKCLEAKYVNAKTIMKWKCDKCNSEFNLRYGKLRDSGSWCPMCKIDRQIVKNACNTIKKRSKIR